jgi:hypothetical protein
LVPEDPISRKEPFFEEISRALKGMSERRFLLALGSWYSYSSVSRDEITT